MKNKGHQGVKVCLDDVGYTYKPVKQADEISKRIAKSNKILYLHSENFLEFATEVGLNGRSFCPATFCDGRRHKDNFEQSEMYVLDFDNKKSEPYITFKDVLHRAERYDLPIKFAYNTFESSPAKEKFRVIFLHETSVTDKRAAEIIHHALQAIFPESDKSCSFVNLYFGKYAQGNGELLHYEHHMDTFDIETLIRGMTHHLRDTYGDTNYKRNIASFARKHGIALDKKGFLDIRRVENIDDVPAGLNPISELIQKSNTQEQPGALTLCDTPKDTDSSNGSDTLNTQSDKKLPNPFIVLNSNSSIMGSGNKLSNIQYHIRLNPQNTGTVSGYVENIMGENIKRERTPYRSNVLNEIGDVCRLYREFESGKKPTHDEMKGLADNMIQIESGDARFMEIITKNDYFKDRIWKYDKWARDVKFFRMSEYKAQSCVAFCRYKDKCTHGRNILLTVRPRFPMRIAGYVEDLAPIEDVEKELDKYLDKALAGSSDADEHRIAAICAQTAIGKTRAFVERMKTLDLAVAAPTNNLKRELYDRAVAEGVPDVKAVAYNGEH